VNQTISNRSVVKRSPNHVATDMAGETVVLDMKSGMYYGMDSVASSIWNLIEEPKTLQEIRAAILEEYDIDAESCDRDVQAFVGALESAGLVEVSNEHAG
jgi:hypothetical protein